DAAAVDVARKNDRNVSRAREAHVGDVPGPQIDLGGTARAFHDHEAGVRFQAIEALEHGAEKAGLQLGVRARLDRRYSPALHDDLRSRLRFRLEQNRVHVCDGLAPAGQGLQSLCTPDLATV